MWKAANPRKRSDRYTAASLPINIPPKRSRTPTKHIHHFPPALTTGVEQDEILAETASIKSKATAVIKSCSPFRVTHMRDKISNGLGPSYKVSKSRIL